MTTPRRLRASDAIDLARADAEIDAMRAEVRNRLVIKREDARAACSEYFALVASKRLPAPSCPGCEARELEKQPSSRGGH